MLEAFATQLEDLLDRVTAFREAVATHRTLEELELKNERNRIMRLELLLAMGSTSLALTATVASVFGVSKGPAHAALGLGQCLHPRQRRVELDVRSYNALAAPRCPGQLSRRAAHRL